ncbi:MAG: glucoamylase family protein [Anaeromyxobacter sp.]
MPRRLLAAVLAALPLVAAAAPAERPVSPFVDDLQRRAFLYFWERADPRTGLVPDRWPTKSYMHVAGVGFALTAVPIGAARGWITRAEARDRVLTTLRFLHDAPQGPAVHGTAGYKGFFYRYLEPETGTRWGHIELSTVDTALLMGGVLFAGGWFDGADPAEAEIRKLADDLFTRVDWKWMQLRGGAICHGWVPDTRRAAADLIVEGRSAGTSGEPTPGHLVLDWKGNNEAMIVYLAALGNPEHGVGPEAWEAWTSTYARDWGNVYGQEHLSFVALFAHQFTQTWFDLRGVRDAWGRAKGLDYFENSRRAAYSQRAYATMNPMRWRDYGENVWGLSATDGPIDVKLDTPEGPRSFRTYAARGISLREQVDDGTLSPSGLISSIAFAPEIVLPAVEEMGRRYGGYAIGRYGFLEALNPSFVYPMRLHHGRVVEDGTPEGKGWVDTDWLAIDQGPIVAMIENYRTGLVWNTVRKSPHVRRALERAGFTGGWLDEPGVKPPSGTAK